MATERPRRVDHRYYVETFYPSNVCYSCKLCPTAFTSGEGITRHLAEHALDALLGSAGLTRA